MQPRGLGVWRLGFGLGLRARPWLAGARGQAKAGWRGDAKHVAERTEDAAEAGVGGDEGFDARLGEPAGELGGVAANFVAAIGDKAEAARQGGEAARDGGTALAGGVLGGTRGGFAGWREGAGLEFRDEGGEAGGETAEAGIDGIGDAVVARAEGAAIAARGDGPAEGFDDPDECGDVCPCLHEHK